MASVRPWLVQPEAVFCRTMSFMSYKMYHNVKKLPIGLLNMLKYLHFRCEVTMELTYVSDHIAAS